MDSNQSANPFAQHYMEISALDPTGQSPVLPMAATKPGLFIGLPIMIFFGVFIAAFAIIFYKRMRHLRTVLAVFVFALILGALPLAMQSMGQKSEMSIKANPLNTPTNFIVSSVTPTGFVIAWETSQPTSGAIKITQDPSFKTGVRVYNDGQPKDYHRLVILNLIPGGTYHLEVLADTQWYNHAGQPIAITLPQNNLKE
jgi:hypothetical protein